MSLFALGLTLDTLGKVLLGITVLMAHWHVSKEHAIDADVLRVMRREKILGVLGIILIIIGYILMLMS